MLSKLEIKSDKKTESCRLRKNRELSFTQIQRAVVYAKTSNISMDNCSNYYLNIKAFCSNPRDVNKKYEVPVLSLQEI